MAETGDIVAGATGVGAFFGALFGAWKIFKPATQPEKGAGMETRVARLEERADEQDRRESERLQWRAEIFARLLDLDKKVSSILAIMDERREHR
jgi:hypothetical protein